MARRYANQGQALIDGYARGAQLAREWEDDQIKKQLSGIADAKVQSDSGFTPDQGANLSELDTGGQHQITYEDGKGYVATPKAGGDPIVLSPVARFKFLDKTYDTAPTDAQISQDRMMAMSGVMAKRDPVEAMRMRQQAENQAYENTRRQRETQTWDEAQALRGQIRDAGNIGVTEQASGEQAATAGQSALDIALANAKTDEERAKITQSYQPTLQALDAQRQTPAQFLLNGKTFAARPTADQVSAEQNAARIKAISAVDPERAMSLERNSMEVEKGRTEAETRGKMRTVDTALRDWAGKNVPKDEQGNPVLNDDLMVKMTKMRTLLLSQQGLFDHAMQTAKDGMQYAAAKIQTDTAARQVATRDAVAAAGMGDFDKALQVYKQFVPDGADPVSITKGDKGSLVLNRKSALDWAPLPPIVFKDMDHFLSALNSLSDGNALGAYVERTFKHDIESRKVKADETRAGASATVANVAAAKETRANTREDAVTKGLVDYFEAEAKDDKQGMSAARRAILANGGKLEKPDDVATEFKPNPIGMGGTAVQKERGGRMIITPVPVDAKGKVVIEPPVRSSGGAAKKGVSIADPFAVGANQPDANAPNSGSQERPVQQPDPDPVGRAVDDARDIKRSAQAAVNSYGVLKRKQDPQGYQDAIKALEAAKNAEKSALSEWESAQAKRPNSTLIAQ